MTNFENITASPEALAKFINNAADLAYREQCFISDPCYGTDCERCITKWLKQEARDEK